MKVVIQNQTHYLDLVQPGTYVQMQDGSGAFVAYTSSLSAARVYNSPDAAVYAIGRRNDAWGLTHPATFALVPVEVNPPTPTPPTVRRLI